MQQAKKALTDGPIFQVLKFIKFGKAIEDQEKWQKQKEVCEQNIIKLFKLSENKSSAFAEKHLHSLIMLNKRDEAKRLFAEKLTNKDFIDSRF